MNGKPGSRKSTLMKHIYDNPKTRQFLADWSRCGPGAPMPCCIATFFFWNSGTNMQKSIQGLLRSLQFQILAKYPDLIPLAFPNGWAMLYNTADTLTDPITHRGLFSLNGVQMAFKNVIEQRHIPLKICFFIDGLDEFSGDTEQLCVYFKQSAERSDNVKFCLSSRPWVQFQQTLDDFPGLKLQDLTSNDIKTFVNDKFHQSPAVMKLAAHDSRLASRLIEEVVERADGVFIWVDVVVRQLLRGVAQRDSISQLLS